MTELQLSARAVAAVERILAIRRLAVSFAESLEAQMMEQLHILRKEVQDDAVFDQVVSGRLSMDPDKARQMAKVWDGAPQEPSPARLAHQAPTEALRTVRELVDQDVPLDDDDSRVAEILTQPPRQRSRTVAAMLDNAEEDLPDAGPVYEPDAPRVSVQLRKLSELSGELTAVMADLAARAGEVKPSARDKALAVMDTLTGATEELGAALMDGGFVMPGKPAQENIIRSVNEAFVLMRELNGGFDADGPFSDDLLRLATVLINMAWRKAGRPELVIPLQAGLGLDRTDLPEKMARIENAVEEIQKVISTEDGS